MTCIHDWITVPSTTKRNVFVYICRKCNLHRYNPKVIEEVSDGNGNK